MENSVNRSYTDESIAELVHAFENATISRDSWRHADHIVVAIHYLANSDLETAAEKMRSGILNLLQRGFGVDLSKEMPYHETITIFWMRTAHSFALENGGLSLTEKANALVEKCDKDYPLRFYSRELLFSDEARARYVEPDLQASATSINAPR